MEFIDYATVSHGSLWLLISLSFFQKWHRQLPVWE